MYFSKKTWFRFLSDKRPGKFAFDDFDSEYHRICGLDENLEDTPKYLTHEKNGKRTDYGLVQRYVVRYGNRNLVVLGLRVPLYPSRPHHQWANRSPGFRRADENLLPF